jgi:NitT/TauT family transport system substrate-binding protein
MAGENLMKRTLPIFLCIALLLAACGSKASGSLTEERLPLGYIPDIQFSPLYVAAERGYFEDAGIQVTFDYSMETDIAALVGADQIQFGVVSGEQVLLARAQGLPIVYVVAWFQQYPVSLVAKTTQNIHTPADLRGKTIGLPGLYGANYIGLRALLHAGGLSEADVKLDSIKYTQVEALATDHDQVVSVYTNNEPLQLRSQGYEITELRVADYLQLASNGLITNEKTIAENPDLVSRMVKAFLKGLADCIADPDAAYEISKGYVENLAQLDATLQKQKLATTIELWKAERLGASQPKAWESMQAVLLDMGLLTQPQDISKAFTNDFLPKK